MKISRLEAVLYTLFHFVKLSSSHPGLASRSSQNPLLPLTVVPVPDQDVDLHDLQNLVPSYKTTLKYADSHGSQATQLNFETTYGVVALENTAYISHIVCSTDSSISITFTSHDAFDMVETWPRTNLILITNHPHCNKESERGLYLTKSCTRDREKSKIKCYTQAKTWKDVTNTIRIDLSNSNTAGSDSTLSQVVTSKSQVAHAKRSDVKATKTKALCVSTKIPPFPKGIHCGALGTLKHPDVLVSSIKTGLDECRDACLQNKSCKSFSFNQNNDMCTLLKKALIAQGYSAAIENPGVLYFSRHCFSTRCDISTALTASSTVTTVLPDTTSTSDAISTSDTILASDTASVSETTSTSDTTTIPSSTTATSLSVPSLSPEDQSTYNSIIENLVYNPNGHIQLNTTGFTDVEFTIANDAYQPDNATIQAQLQNMLDNDQLTPAPILLQEATSGLNNAASSVYAITPDMNVIENIPAGYSNPSSTKIRRESIGLETHEIVHHRRDLYDWIISELQDDLVGELLEMACEECAPLIAAYEYYGYYEDLNDIAEYLEDFGGSGSTISGGSSSSGSGPTPPQTTPTPQPLQPVDFGGTISATADLSVPSGTVMDSDGSGNSITCVACGIQVSALTLSGSVEVDIKSKTILMAQITVYMTSEASAILGVNTVGPYFGSFDSALGTLPIPSISVDGIFSIVPQFIFGVGGTYQTDSAMTVSAGTTMSVANGNVILDLIAAHSNGAQGWFPQTNVTYPFLTTPGSITITPYMKSSIELSVNIFGTFFQNPAAIISQSNMGFQVELLTQNTKKRSTSLSPRWDPNNPLTASPHNCSAGSLWLTAYIKAANSVSIGSGSPTTLWLSEFPFGARCFQSNDSSLPSTPQPIVPDQNCIDGFPAGLYISYGTEYNISCGVMPPPAPNGIYLYNGQQYGAYPAGTLDLCLESCGVLTYTYPSLPPCDAIVFNPDTGNCYFLENDDNPLLQVPISGYPNNMIYANVVL